jgi:hypothetical protein
MHYDFTAIPEADVPQAIEPVFQHVVATYASEANKTASVWQAVPDHLLDFRPHEKTNPILKLRLSAPRLLGGDTLELCHGAAVVRLRDEAFGPLIIVNTHNQRVPIEHENAPVRFVLPLSHDFRIGGRGEGVDLLGAGIQIDQLERAGLDNPTVQFGLP